MCKLIPVQRSYTTVTGAQHVLKCDLRHLSMGLATEQEKFEQEIS